MSALWMMPTYRARSWAYMQLPEAGDVVRYMDEGFEVRVTHIRRGYVLLSDGTTFRKRVDWRRIGAWITDRLPNKSATVDTSPVRAVTARRQRPLRPSMHYVQNVNLLR